MKTLNFPAKKQKHQQEAQDRKVFRDKLTTAQQIDILKTRPGKSQKEIERLLNK